LPITLSAIYCDSDTRDASCCVIARHYYLRETFLCVTWLIRWSIIVLSWFTYTYICVEIAKISRSVREISRIRCLLWRESTLRADGYTLQIWETKYEACSKTNLHLTRDTRAITDNLAVRVAPIYHTVVVANLLVRSKSYLKAPLYKNRCFPSFLNLEIQILPLHEIKIEIKWNNTFCLNHYSYF